MATIYPFRALRYNPDRVDLADVVTQPYDKITPAMQDRYYALSPFNLVRIILGRREQNDNGQNVYTRAAAYLREWRQNGVLAPDPDPSIYLYSQEFTVPGDSSAHVFQRRGFIALGRVEDYDNGIVHRHEQTLSGPKVDRLNLLRATECHFGQIFMLYSDPEHRVDEILTSGTQIASGSPEAGSAAGVRTSTKPAADVVDEYGVRHRMWAISDPTVIKAVQEAMLNKMLIIADGHHRYETALNYRNERRAKAGALLPEAPYERVMMTFVNMDAEGLVILPTHRVVFGLENFNAVQFVEEARAFFTVNPLRERATAGIATKLLRERGSDSTALIAVTTQGDFLLESRGGSSADSLLSGMSPKQGELDVVQLHKLLLEHVLGISEEAIRNQVHVRYVRDSDEAIEQVRRGDANISFLMNPARMDQVRDIAFAGQVLPQKSTDFYPKLLSGLTIYALE
ncbi:MAG TPA: DUF1015 domain-containing protein [Terriglobales bacterium]|nr:DUF1015 domain-containing protein [Terriglobales bacterium]